MAKRIEISNKLRFSILIRDRRTCEYCGRKSPEVKLAVDHVIPASKGGDNSIFNLVTSCTECNSAKLAKILPDEIINEIIEGIKNRSVENMSSENNDVPPSKIIRDETEITLEREYEEYLLNKTTLKKLTADAVFGAPKKRERVDGYPGLYFYKVSQDDVRYSYNMTIRGNRINGTLPPGTSLQRAKDYWSDLKIHPITRKKSNGVSTSLGFKEFVRKIYLPRKLAAGIKVYDRLGIYNQMMDCFGNKTLDDINPEDIQIYLDGMYRQRGLGGEKQLVSSQTRLRCLTYLSGIFTEALKDGFVRGNPVKKVKRPKRTPNERQRAIAKKIDRYLTKDEYQCLIAVADPDMRALIEFAINMGIRQGLLMSLKWKDVKDDFTAVTIGHQVINCNEASRAALQYMKELRLASVPEDERPDLSSEQVFVFRRLRVSRFIGGKAVSVEPSDEGFLETFPRVRWEHLIQSLGWTMDNPDPRLKGWRFLDLKHTFASWNRLGLKSFSVTKQYNHLYAEISDEIKKSSPLSFPP